MAKEKVAKGLYVEVGAYKGKEIMDGYFKEGKHEPLLYIGSADKQDMEKMLNAVKEKITELKKKGLDKVI
jgi:hypothetical protein